MPDHYYSNTPTSEHKAAQVRLTLLGQEFTFDTDAGVFSREALDYGSRVLIEAAPECAGRALDLGCGWGAVGIVLARLNADARFELCDVNERAVGLAAANIIKNRAQNARAIVSDGFTQIEGNFDFIFSNPPIRAGKSTVYALLECGLERLTPGGRLIFVIRKQQGAPSALAHMREIAGNAEIIARSAGYWVIEVIKREERGATAEQ